MAAQQAARAQTNPPPGTFGYASNGGAVQPQHVELGAAGHGYPYNPQNPVYGHAAASSQSVGGSPHASGRQVAPVAAAPPGGDQMAAAAAPGAPAPFRKYHPLDEEADPDAGKYKSDDKCFEFPYKKVLHTTHYCILDQNPRKHVRAAYRDLKKRYGFITVWLFENQHIISSLGVISALFQVALVVVAGFFGSGGETRVNDVVAACCSGVGTILIAIKPYQLFRYRQRLGIEFANEEAKIAAYEASLRHSPVDHTSCTFFRCMCCSYNTVRSDDITVNRELNREGPCTCTYQQIQCCAICVPPCALYKWWYTDPALLAHGLRTTDMHHRKYAMEDFSQEYGSASQQAEQFFQYALVGAGLLLLAAFLQVPVSEGSSYSQVVADLYGNSGSVAGDVPRDRAFEVSFYKAHVDLFLVPLFNPLYYTYSAMFPLTSAVSSTNVNGKHAIVFEDPRAWVMSFVRRAKQHNEDPEHAAIVAGAMLVEAMDRDKNQCCRNLCLRTTSLQLLGTAGFMLFIITWVAFIFHDQELNEQGVEA